MQKSHACVPNIKMQHQTPLYTPFLSSLLKAPLHNPTLMNAKIFHISCTSFSILMNRLSNRVMAVIHVDTKYQKYDRQNRK